MSVVFVVHLKEENAINRLMGDKVNVRKHWLFCDLYV